MRKVLADSRIDLILLDLMLPGEDGLSLCRSLRAGSGIPIIMLTAKGDELDRVIGLEMGADDYLPKPFGSREPLRASGQSCDAARRPHRRANPPKRPTLPLRSLAARYRSQGAAPRRWRHHCPQHRENTIC